MPRVKKLLLFAVLGAIFYFLLSYHVILTNRGTRLLRKSTFTLEYTFFSTKGKSNKTILAVDALREDGIGDLLKEEGLMSEQEEALILQSLNAK